MLDYVVEINIFNLALLGRDANPNTSHKSIRRPPPRRRRADRGQNAQLRYPLILYVRCHAY